MAELRVRRAVGMLLLMLGLNAISAWGATEDDNPTPIPVSAGTPAEPGMPLEVYRALRERLDGAAAGLDAEVRTHEAAVLAALESDRSLQRDLAIRLSPFVADRSRAARVLGRIVQNGKEPDGRALAAQALAEMGDAAGVESLLNGLADSEEEVRGLCALGLGRIRDRRAVPGLLDSAKSDLSPHVRAQCVLSIGLIGEGFERSDLARLLDEESDDRVRMAIASTIRGLDGTLAEDLAVPSSDDVGARLAELGGEMDGVAKKLREDRHDEVVQLEGLQVEQKIEKLIKEIENAQPLNGMQASGAKGRRGWRGRLAQSYGESRILAGSGGGSRPDAPDSYRVRQAAGRREAWSQLPPKERAELLQVFQPEVPVQWRRRVEAYFLSLAAEEAAQKNKKK